MTELYWEILGRIEGEDVTREGLLDTPKRAAKAIKELTVGYQMDPQEILNNAIFHEECDEMVIVRNIEFHSLCEHHILPFWGSVDVAYIPNKKIIGLSKIPRIVDIFAKRLQVQERLTNQIAETLQDLLDPQGIGVVCRGQHMCMIMRGIQKQNADMVTNSMKGALRDDLSARQEFLSMIKE